MPNRQPPAPQGPPPRRSPPIEEANLVICTSLDHLTPEQRKWPVWQIPGTQALHELVPADQLPPGYSHPDYHPAPNTTNLGPT